MHQSVLLIAPYENIYPPMNGGMQRCFHIIHQLAKYFDLTVIMHQSSNSFIKAVEVYPEICSVKIYSTKDEKPSGDILSLLPEKLENAIRYRWIKKDFTKPADGSFLKYYPVLKRLLKNNQYDTIILENLFTTNAIKTIRKYAKTATIIYDAHNVDSNLAETAMVTPGISSKHLNGIWKAESTLYKNVDALLTCSENDRSDFLKMNEHKLSKATVISNGVTIGHMYDEGVKQVVPEYILFCGALWTPPNSEGLFWFYKNIWTRIKSIFPLLKLLIVGSGQLPTRYGELYKDTSLVFTGSVEDVKPLYNKASIAIVPLLSGSGTRLKILEAMSLGLPVISTPKGAEGIDYVDEKDILIAETAVEFAEKLKILLREKGRRVSISKAARDLVEKKYDWNIIGKVMADFTNSLNLKD
jgi:glycosyltransferase involved in cell wall biosynthesis